jgi:hypothetical protein
MGTLNICLKVPDKGYVSSILLLHLRSVGISMFILLNMYQLDKKSQCKAADHSKVNTVKPLSIVPVTVVRPHVSSALFGPEISPI